MRFLPIAGPCMVGEWGFGENTFKKFRLILRSVSKIVSSLTLRGWFFTFDLYHLHLFFVCDVK